MSLPTLPSSLTPDSLFRRVLASTLAYVLVAAACLWLFACLALWAGQERLLFYPRGLDKHTQERLGAHELHATAADGTPLAGWALPGTGSAPGAVVYFGGNAEEISSELERYAILTGLPTGGLNYRGYGLSGGKPGAAALQADALVAFDAVVERLGIEPHQVLVIGRSLGSNLAAVVAARRMVGGVVLLTPYDSIAELAAHHYPLFPARTLLRHHFDTVPLTADIAAPVLVVRAGADRLVTPASTARLLAGWRGSGTVAEVVVDNVGHNRIVDHEDCLRAVQGFAAQVLGTAG